MENQILYVISAYIFTGIVVIIFALKSILLNKKIKKQFNDVANNEIKKE